jgi:ATP-dependent protease ClpP protease subunit
VKRTISILGPIGSFKYLNAQGIEVEINGIQIADVVAQISSLPKGVTELEILFGTPGGLIPVGEAIYNYLLGLGSRMDVTMVQVDDVASIGTVMWFAGKKRLAAMGTNPRTGKEYAFQPHNPWKPHTQGDAAAHEAEAVKLRDQENKMAAFYQEQTGLPQEAILPIMKADAPFNAEKAVALKFATGTYEPLKQAAFQINQPMKPEEKTSLFKGFLSLLGMDDAPGATPPPASTGADLMNKPVVIDGKPAPDGVYTVKGGVVTLVAAIPAAAPAAAQAPAAAAAPVAGAAPVNFNPEKLSEAIAATVEKALDAQKKEFEAQILAMKKNIKTSHVPAGPEGYNPSTKEEDVKQFNTLHKSGELLALKKSDPETYKRLHFSRYGTIPNV